MSLNGKTATTTDVVIENNGFWPSVELQVFINLFRIPAEYTPDTIAHEFNAAVRIINTDVSEALIAAKDAGLTEVSEIEGLKDDYRDALYNYARQRLVRVFETLNRKEAADVQGDRANEVTDRWVFESARFVNRVNRSLTEYAESEGVASADGFRVSLL